MSLSRKKELSWLHLTALLLLLLALLNHDSVSHPCSDWKMALLCPTPATFHLLQKISFILVWWIKDVGCGRIPAHKPNPLPALFPLGKEDSLEEL